MQKRRTKFVEIVATHDRAITSNMYLKLFEKSKVYGFTGRPAESHRLIVFSAGLENEADVTPWSTPTPWTDTSEAILDFCKTQRGQSDVIMAFDGRSRACRNAIQSVMEERRHFCELWVV